MTTTVVLGYVVIVFAYVAAHAMWRLRRRAIRADLARIEAGARVAAGSGGISPARAQLERLHRLVLAEERLVARLGQIWERCAAGTDSASTPELATDAEWQQVDAQLSDVQQRLDATRAETETVLGEVAVADAQAAGAGRRRFWAAILGEYVVFVAAMFGLLVAVPALISAW